VSIADRRGREGKSTRWQASGGSGGARERERDRRMVIDHGRRTGGRGGAAFAGLVVVSSWVRKLRHGGGGRAAQPPDRRWRAPREGKRMQRVVVKAARGVALFYTPCLGTRHISCAERRQTRSGRRSGGLGALVRMGQLTRTQIATSIRLARMSNESHTGSRSGQAFGWRSSTTPGK